MQPMMNDDDDDASLAQCRTFCWVCTVVFMG